MDLVCLSYFLFLHAIPDKYDDDDQISVWSTSCSQTPCANKMYVCGGVWVCVCVCVCVCVYIQSSQNCIQTSSTFIKLSQFICYSVER